MSPLTHSHETTEANSEHSKSLKTEQCKGWHCRCYLDKVWKQCACVFCKCARMPVSGNLIKGDGTASRTSGAGSRWGCINESRLNSFVSEIGAWVLPLRQCALTVYVCYSVCFRGSPVLSLLAIQLKRWCQHFFNVIDRDRLSLLLQTC